MSVRFINAGAQAAVTTTSQSVALPASIRAGDLLLAIVMSRRLTAPTWTFPGGWANRASVFSSLPGTGDNTLETWWKIAEASESDPTIQISDGTNGWSGQIAAYRGVDLGAPWDVAANAEGESGGAGQLTPGGVTTLTPNALAISVVGSIGTNAFTIQTAQGFTARMSGAAYDTTVGVDHTIGLADAEVVAPGAVTMLTWDAAGAGSPDWVYITDALRAEAFPPLVIVPTLLQRVYP